MKSVPSDVGALQYGRHAPDIIVSSAYKADKAVCRLCSHA